MSVRREAGCGTFVFWAGGGRRDWKKWREAGGGTPAQPWYRRIQYSKTFSEKNGFFSYAYDLLKNDHSRQKQLKTVPTADAQKAH